MLREGGGGGGVTLGVAIGNDEGTSAVFEFGSIIKTLKHQAWETDGEARRTRAV